MGMPMWGKSCPSFTPPLGKDTISRRKKALLPLWTVSIPFELQRAHHLTVLSLWVPVGLWSSRGSGRANASEADGCVVMVWGAVVPRQPSSACTSDACQQDGQMVLTPAQLLPADLLIWPIEPSLF